MDPKSLDRKALVAAFATFGLWGSLFPLLFQAMGRAGAEPFEMTAWRAVASVPLVVVMVVWTRQGGAFLDVLRSPRSLGALVLSGLLIGTNWALYVWAVDSGHVLAASLGYYINPLINMLLGAVLFGERVDRLGKAAVALAAVGVALQTWAVGELPWIALVLATSFGVYTVLRKTAPVEAQTGLLVECLVLMIPAGGYLLWLAGQGNMAFGTSTGVSLLLLVGGPATVLPLFTFAYSARRLPLTAIAFLQFTQPGLLFVIGALQGEPLNSLRLLSFAFIWVGVGVFVYGAWRRMRSA